jgi:GNAT superfamily N-acetyltransferase
MVLRLRPATIENVELLVEMNKQLIQDEVSRNPMNIAELTNRMRNFILGNWNTVFILDDEDIIGYALYQFRSDEYYPEKQVVYLRQFFISPEHRSKGYGKTALKLLREEQFGYQTNVVIDVLSTNQRGKSFWDSVGFKDYCVTMKLPPTT